MESKTISDKIRYPEINDQKVNEQNKKTTAREV